MGFTVLLQDPLLDVHLPPDLAVLGPFLHTSSPRSTAFFLSLEFLWLCLYRLPAWEDEDRVLSEGIWPPGQSEPLFPGWLGSSVDLGEGMSSKTWGALDCEIVWFIFFIHISQYGVLFCLAVCVCVCIQINVIIIIDFESCYLIKLFHCFYSFLVNCLEFSSYIIILYLPSGTSSPFFESSPFKFLYI